MPCEFGLAICLCFLLTRGPVLLGLGWGKRRGERGAGREGGLGKGEGVSLETRYEGPHVPSQNARGECGGGIRMVLITL